MSFEFDRGLEDILEGLYIMNNKIYKYKMDDLNLLLDINSGAVHVIDEITYDLLDIYNGSNKEAVLNNLEAKYKQEEMLEAIAEIDALIKGELLFTPDIEVPSMFKENAIVKSLCLHVAHDCNLRCGYCFAGTGDFGHSRGLMSFDIAKKAVDFIVDKSGSRKNCEIDFFGGEPLLNMDVVKQTVEYIKSKEEITGKKFKLTLTTNAMLLDDANIKYLNDENISLVLSLDGRKEVHDAIRPACDGSGTYDEILHNIKNAVEGRNHQNYYLRGTFTAHNLDFCADVISMADNGFNLLSVEPVVGKDADYVIKEEHLPTLFAEYEKLAKEYLTRKIEGLGFEFFHFNINLDNGPCVAKRLSGCGAGHEYMAVTPEGDLYPCHQFVGREDFLLGNVFEGVKNTTIPAEFRETHVLAKEACHNCWARFYCSGGCHANAEAMHGTITKPYEIGCELQKKRLECAIYIQAKLALLNAGKQ